MAKIDVLDILKAKQVNPLEFNFDNLSIPPIWNYLTQEDIDKLHSIAVSIRLSSKIEQKYKMIDEIMTKRGFRRFSAGTNRVVYRFYEDTRFLVKIAVDKVGMQDNPMEYENQFELKPYVAKTFYVSPCGTVGFAERVLPIKNKQEFKEIAGDVFEILVNKILGKYVMEDIGTKYFMNWGVRFGYGPVLLDYPYCYKLDGSKLYCTATTLGTSSEMCNGEIDYDAGFNHLVCTKCGKVYLANSLRDDSIDNKIIIQGGSSRMKVTLMRGDLPVYTSVRTDDTMVIPKNTTKKTTLKISKTDKNGETTILDQKLADIIQPKDIENNENKLPDLFEYDDLLDDHSIESNQFPPRKDTESHEELELDDDIEFDESPVLMDQPMEDSEDEDSDERQKEEEEADEEDEEESSETELEQGISTNDSEEIQDRPEEESKSSSIIIQRSSNKKKNIDDIPTPKFKYTFIPSQQE